MLVEVTAERGKVRSLLRVAGLLVGAAGVVVNPALLVAGSRGGARWRRARAAF